METDTLIVVDDSKLLTSRQRKNPLTHNSDSCANYFDNPVQGKNDKFPNHAPNVANTRYSHLIEPIDGATNTTIRKVTEIHEYSDDTANEKPILISSSKGGFFKQGHTIIISPNFKNVVTYQWIKNGISLEHCTGPILEISNASLYHTGEYALIAANTFGIEITPPINVRIV